MKNYSACECASALTCAAFGEIFMVKTYLEVTTCVVLVTAAVLVAIARCTNCSLPIPR